MTTKDLVRQSKSLVPSVHQRVVIGRGRGLRQFPWPVAPATRVQHGRRHHQSHDAATGRRRRRSRSAPHAAIFPGRPLIVAHGGSESRARTRLQRKQLTRRHCHAKTLRSRNQLTVCSLLRRPLNFCASASPGWLRRACGATAPPTRNTTVLFGIRKAVSSVTSNLGCGCRRASARKVGVYASNPDQ
jgi:hypothetical protein